MQRLYKKNLSFSPSFFWQYITPRKLLQELNGYYTLSRRRAMFTSQGESLKTSTYFSGAGHTPENGAWPIPISAFYI